MEIVDNSKWLDPPDDPLRSDATDAGMNILQRTCRSMAGYGCARTVWRWPRTMENNMTFKDWLLAAFILLVLFGTCLGGCGGAW